MLLSNYENLILNQNLYTKSYIFKKKKNIFNLNADTKSYNFKLLQTFKYTFLKKQNLKKKKNLKKNLIILNLISNLNFFLVNKKNINNYKILTSLFKSLNNNNFKSFYIYFFKKIINFTAEKESKEDLTNKILEYKPLNVTRYVYNFKRKEFLNLNIYYIKQKEKKKLNNLNLYFLKKHNLINNNNLLLVLKKNLTNNVYLKFLNVLENNILLNNDSKQYNLKIKNLSSNIKYIYYLFYIYSLFIKKKN